MSFPMPCFIVSLFIHHVYLGGEDVVDTYYPAPAQVHVKMHAPTSPLFLCFLLLNKVICKKIFTILKTRSVSEVLVGNKVENMT